jgi:hypothetical protein
VALDHVVSDGITASRAEQKISFSSITNMGTIALRFFAPLNQPQNACAQIFPTVWKNHAMLHGGMAGEANFGCSGTVWSSPVSLG